MSDRNSYILLLLIVFSGALLTLQELVTALALTAAVVLAAVGQARGWWVWLARMCWVGLLRVWGWINRPRAVADAERPLYELLLGYDPETRQPDVELLPGLGHIGVYGTSRFGKTTLLHSLIHDLISHHRPSDLRLLIVDPKEVDYAFYSRLPHLLRPIARDTAETAVLVQFLLDEMKHRASLFTPYAERAVCNSLDRYAELSGQVLPRILIVFDELADVILPGSQLESDLVRLSKKSLAYGIQCVFATQRPSSKVVTGEIKSQVSSRFIGWMPTAREYGVVAETPREMYESMPRTPGRFMVYTANGWRFMQGYKIPDRQLERMAGRYASRPRVWPDTTMDTAAAAAESVWTGDDDQKVTMLRAFERELGDRPSINEVCSRFDVSRPTAIKYRKMAWG